MEDDDCGVRIMIARVDQVGGGGGSNRNNNVLTKDRRNYTLYIKQVK